MNVRLIISVAQSFIYLFICLIQIIILYAKNFLIFEFLNNNLSNTYRVFHYQTDKPAEDIGAQRRLRI